MKKLIISIFCVILGCNVFALNFMEGSTNNRSDVSIKNAAIFIRPFEIYQNIKKVLFGLCIESQSAFNSLWGLRANTDYLFNNTIFDVNLTIGPQINIMNNGLEGLLVGVYPGIKFSENIESFNFLPNLFVECTYNIKMERNWGVGFYISSDLLKSSNLSAGVKIGKYLSNSYYR